MNPVDFNLFECLCILTGTLICIPRVHFSLKYGKIILTKQSKCLSLMYSISKNLSSKFMDIFLMIGLIKYFVFNIFFRLSSANLLAINFCCLLFFLK